MYNKIMKLSTEDQEKEIQEIVNSISVTDSPSTVKKAIHTLGTYGKKAIPYITNIADDSIDDDVRTYAMDIISQINNKGLT
jgi:hypothetical protein